MTVKSIRRLLLAARRASLFAHAPYSHFPVGAAVLSDDGRCFTGCNIENASYGLTICAERNAIFTALASGARKVTAVAVFTPTNRPTAPCGACRQVIREFATLDVPIMFGCLSGEFVERSLRQLLPDDFGPESLGISDSTLMQSVSAKFSICVDIDNVLIQTDALMRKIIYEVTNGRVCLEYENVTRFNYYECFDPLGNQLTREEWHVVHDRFSERDDLAYLEPIAGAVRGVEAIAREWDVHLATSRLPRARVSTAAWLKLHGLQDFPLHFTGFHKHRSLPQFFACIDDSFEQSIEFANHGVAVNLVFAQPWNTEAIQDTRLERIGSWSEIVNRVSDLS